MIKNGRPYTIENGYEDSGLITSRRDVDIRAVGTWIRENIRKGRTVYKGRTSYGLKHVLERDTGIYLTNNEFKDAMLLTGYFPVDAAELNWRYRIVMVKEEHYNPNPFCRWMRKEYGGESSPEGDFASDMERDPEFPIFADRGIILGYLRNVNACDGAIEAFENAWKRYEREKH